MKKIVIIVSVVVAGSLAFAVARAQDTTGAIAEIKARIVSLLQEVEGLQQKLKALEAQEPARWCYTFNADMGVGASGDEVAALHSALEREGFTVPGSKTEYTEETAAAVSGLQAKYKKDILDAGNLPGPTGYAGKRTLKKLNQFYGCSDKPVKKADPPKPYPSKQAAGIQIFELSPAKGPVGTQVTIRGSGFNGPNKITFGDGAVVNGETGVHYSKDGKTITFIVPRTLAPECAFGPQPCEIATKPTTPGIYPVVVTSGEAKSNPAIFMVTEGKDPSAEFPAVKVVDPAQGETLVPGEPAVAVWNSSGNAAQFDVYMFPAGYVSEFDERRVVIVRGLSGDNRGHKFTVPKVADGKYQIVVRQIVDASPGHTASYVEGRSGVFTIGTARPIPTPPPLVTLAEVTYPKGGEVFAPGTQVNIQWKLTAAATKRPLRAVGLYLTKSNSYPYPYEKPTPIVEYFPSSSAGSYAWTVPATPGEYLIVLQPITVAGLGGETATPSGRFTIRAATPPTY